MVAINSNEATGQLRAGVMTLSDGRARWLKDTPWEQTAGTISPDGRTMVVQTNADGRSQLSLVDVASLSETAAAVSARGQCAGQQQPAVGRRRPLAGLRNGADSPADYWAVDPGSGAAEQMTRMAIASLDSANLPKSRIVAYKSADGTPISAILTMPFNLRRDGGNPAIVIPQGGPTGQSQDNFSSTATMLASRGYIVLRPNFRGSTGYGRAFQDANIKDLGGGDLDDVVAGAQFLSATGYVDAKRIGITGGQLWRLHDIDGARQAARRLCRGSQTVRHHQLVFDVGE